MSPSKRTLWSLALALVLAASVPPPAAAAGPETAGVLAPAPSLWLSALLARWPGLAAWLAPEPPSSPSGLSSITSQEEVGLDPNGGAAPAPGVISSPGPEVRSQEGVILDPDG